MSFLFFFFFFTLKSSLRAWSYACLYDAKEFFVFKVFEDFDFESRSHIHTKNDLHDLFFFLSLLCSLKRILGSRSFHPFTSFRIKHFFSFSHSCLLSDSLSLFRSLVFPLIVLILSYSTFGTNAF